MMITKESIQNAINKLDALEHLNFLTGIVISDSIILSELSSIRKDYDLMKYLNIYHDSQLEIITKEKLNTLSTKLIEQIPHLEKQSVSPKKVEKIHNENTKIDSVNHLLALSEALQETKQLEQAQRAYEELLQLDPHNQSARSALHDIEIETERGKNNFPSWYIIIVVLLATAQLIFIIWSVFSDS